MGDLNITYPKTPKGLKIVAILIGIGVMAGGVTIMASSVKNGIYGIPFFSALLNTVLGIAAILANVFWNPASVLQITDSTVETKKMKIDWTSVSKVNIGLGYIVFLLNGEQKQQRMDLSGILYKDIIITKSKIIELCEQKNIPYHND